MAIKISKRDGFIDDSVKDRLRQLEIAMVIDNTGSMGGEIARVRNGLTDLVNQINLHPLRPKTRFAVIGYRDHPPQDSTYVSRVFCALESDMSVVHAALAEMKAAGGGDAPEAVADGLFDALCLSWNGFAQKAVVLVGDAPPQGESGSSAAVGKGCLCGRNTKHLAADMVSRGITGHAIGVRSDARMARAFSEFAKIASGIFVHLNSLADLIPALLRRVDEEMGKIAVDLRTIEKLERGDAISAADRESVERLEKKGVRVMPPHVGTGHLSATNEPKPSRIRIIK